MRTMASIQGILKPVKNDNLGRSRTIGDISDFKDSVNDLEVMDPIKIA